MTESAVAVSSGLGSRPRPRVSWVLRLPYPLRNVVRRWTSLLGMIVGVGIACLGGECFGEAGRGFLRFSCAEPNERLRQALDFLPVALGPKNRVAAYLERHPEFRCRALARQERYDDQHNEAQRDRDEPGLAERNRRFGWIKTIHIFECRGAQEKPGKRADQSNDD